MIYLKSFETVKRHRNIFAEIFVSSIPENKLAAPLAHRIYDALLCEKEACAQNYPFLTLQPQEVKTVMIYKIPKISDPLDIGARQLSKIWMTL